MTPGIYTDLPEEQYHGDKDSLSFSGAKRILQASPAHFKWDLDHGGRPHKEAFDFGHAAHSLVLGVGMEIEVINADDWRTKAAQQQRAEARAAGKAPVLQADYAVAVDMAQAIREHPVASLLFDPAHGKAEVSGAWEDRDTGVLRRFRLDWLPESSGGRLILPDYKTTASADPRALPRKFADFEYHMQDVWYRQGAAACGLADYDDIAFVFVVQEKTPPYAVTVVELDAEAKRIGYQRNQQALAIYADCVRTGVWPAYPTEVALLSLPPWYVRQHDMETYA